VNLGSIYLLRDDFLVLYIWHTLFIMVGIWPGMTCWDELFRRPNLVNIIGIQLLRDDFLVLLLHSFGHTRSVKEICPIIVVALRWVAISVDGLHWRTGSFGMGKFSMRFQRRRRRPAGKNSGLRLWNSVYFYVIINLRCSYSSRSCRKKLDVVFATPPQFWFVT